MASESDALREATPREMKATKVGDDPRAPWWVNYAFRTLLVIGLPTALIGWREFRDYKYEAIRLVVEQDRTKQMERTNSIMERVIGVLYRVEKKLPDENR